MLITKNITASIEAGQKLTVQVPLDDANKYRAINVYDATAGSSVMIVNGWATTPSYDSYTLSLKNMDASGFTDHVLSIAFERISF